MNRSLISIVSAMLLSLPVPLFAGDLTPGELSFFNQHTSDFVRFEPTTLDDPAVKNVFKVPIYSVKLVVEMGDGEQKSTHTVTRLDNRLVPATRPGTDGDLPEFKRMLDPKFRLKGEADAKVLEQALDVVYPPMMESDKKLISHYQEGSNWIFIRGEFFNSKSGYIFETGPGGEIRSVKYQMRIGAPSE